MRLRRLRSASIFCALVAAGVMAGCSSGREAGTGREGRPEELGHLAYNVFLTRQLNLKDPEDVAYYQGKEAPPGYALYGVFISACNESRGGPGYAAASRFRVVDTQGDTYYPTPLPTSNLFGYRPTLVAHRECIPTAGSVPAESPTAGALLLFQIPIAATENRPLDLIITAPPGTSGRQSAKIELDI